MTLHGTSQRHKRIFKIRRNEMEHNGIYHWMFSGIHPWPLVSQNNTVKDILVTASESD